MKPTFRYERVKDKMKVNAKGRAAEVEEESYSELRVTPAGRRLLSFWDWNSGAVELTI